MASQRIIVVGSSAGGIESLSELMHHLRSGFQSTIFIVQHLPPDSIGILTGILRRALHTDDSIEIDFARDGEPITPGRIWVARPDHHLLVERQHMRVIRGPRENLHRPSVDALFRSAANSHGSAVIGIVLSGLLNDGTSGLAAIKRRGGLVIVQDPQEARFPSMPQSAIEHVTVDHVLPVKEIAMLIPSWVGLAEPVPIEIDRTTAAEVVMATGANDEHDKLDGIGQRTMFTCPDCHGTLWEISDAGLRHFRCHVGHSYSEESFQVETIDAQEKALWNALRIIEEQIVLYQRLADRMRHQVDSGIMSARFDERVSQYRQDAMILRSMLQRSHHPIIN
jgi:two-component system chemotaxis response regulator CheB